MSEVRLTNDIPEISIKGFKVVSGEMFARPPKKIGPTCTIWHDHIAFSKTALNALNNCERVRIEINPKAKCLLLVPVTEKDKDGIRWTKDLKEPATRKIGCKLFSSQLYEAWGWKLDTVYRTSGKIVSADKKIMLLFDFNEPETWKRKMKVKKNQNVRN
ncbi:MAG: hypothetical protein HDT47_00230 [Ruminococcaceae bacterium]|nr:hypothetical protein [Oscillospiraceae bacterium]